MKRGILVNRGDTLITVPYWWDGEPARYVQKKRLVSTYLL